MKQTTKTNVSNVVAIQQNQTKMKQKGWGQVSCLVAIHQHSIHPKNARTQKSCYSGNDSQYPQTHATKCHSVSVCFRDVFQITPKYKYNFKTRTHFYYK